MLPRPTPRLVHAAAAGIALHAPLALAQGLLGPGAGLPPIADPPLWELALLEKPSWAAAILIALGVVAFLVLRRSTRARLAPWVLLIALALAGAAIGVGTLVQTQRERVADAARDLVAATGRADARAMTLLLDPAVSVRTRWGSVEGAQRVVDLAGTGVRAAGIRSARAPEVRVEVRADLARSLVRTALDSDDAPPSGWWLVEWARDDDAWRATHIEPLWIPGVDRPAGG